MHVYVVTRDAIIVATLKGFLGAAGHSVQSTNSVTDLMRALRHASSSPALALIDFAIAQTSDTPLGAVRRSYPRTHIGIMSSEETTLNRGTALAMENVAYIRKPLRLSDVESLITLAAGASANTEQREAPPPPTGGPAQGPSAETGPRLNRVLVVDDSALIHTMYRTMLRQRYSKCEIIKALNGQEGLDKLASEGAVDLILLDVNMPVMNGIQFLECIRADATHRNTPVIVITTEGKEEDAVRGLRRGARAYLVKPFKPNILHKLIETVMRRRTPAG